MLEAIIIFVKSIKKASCGMFNLLVSQLYKVQNIDQIFKGHQRPGPSRRRRRDSQDSKKKLITDFIKFLHHNVLS